MEFRVPKYVPDSTELDRTRLGRLDAAALNRPQMASQRQFSVRKPGFESRSGIPGQLRCSERALSKLAGWLALPWPTLRWRLPVLVSAIKQPAF